MTNQHALPYVTKYARVVKPLPHQNVHHAEVDSILAKKLVNCVLEAVKPVIVKQNVQSR